MQGTEATVTNQKNPDSVLRELSLLRKKAREPGVTAELCPIKKDLELNEKLSLKQTTLAQTHPKGRENTNSYWAPSIGL